MPRIQVQSTLVETVKAKLLQVLHSNLFYYTLTPAPMKGQSYRACIIELLMLLPVPNPIFASL
jgi:hypothetical protein